MRSRLLRIDPAGTYAISDRGHRNSTLYRRPAGQVRRCAGDQGADNAAISPASGRYPVPVIMRKGVDTRAAAKSVFVVERHEKLDFTLPTTDLSAER